MHCAFTSLTPPTYTAISAFINLIVRGTIYYTSDKFCYKSVSSIQKLLQQHKQLSQLQYIASPVQTFSINHSV
ncbi:hypothetical protein SUGI_1091180 [Cryptomeria japonica]|nr:hypothetical protein SUGI_1091180 [Cryptomeria japonica]